MDHFHFLWICHLEPDNNVSRRISEDMVRTLLHFVWAASNK